MKGNIDHPQGEPQAVWVMIPSYNEAENIEQLISEINALDIDPQIVVVDDNSPDGTAKIVKRLMDSMKNVHLVLRTEERGRGTAGVAGFKYALDNGAEYVIEMDADFSHHPKHIPDLLKAMEDHDVALGSRFVAGGKNIRKGFIRNLVTVFANIYINLILGVKIKDATSGYRCFKREVLEAIDLDHTVSIGPSVVQELLYKSSLMGFKIKEVPITFVDRYRGMSSFNFRIALQGFIMVLVLRYMFSDIRRIQSGDSHDNPEREN